MVVCHIQINLEGHILLTKTRKNVGTKHKNLKFHFNKSSYCFISSNTDPLYEYHNNK